MVRRAISLAMVILFAAGLGACGEEEAEVEAEAEEEDTAKTAGGGTDGGSGNEVEPGAPEPGAAITFSDVTPTSFTVSWGAATDPGEKSFTYKVVYALSANDIDSVAEANAITGSAVIDELASTVTSETITGLTIATTYAVVVVVTNSEGKSSIYEPAEQATLPKRIFVTTTRMAASFANAAAVDAYCESDAGKPTDGSTYKAMIAGSNWRKACTSPRCVSTGTTGQVDWVFAPSTPYGRKDGTLIGVTDANGILPDPILAVLDPTSNYPIWGGFDSTWQSTGNNCTAWTATGTTADGMVANPYYLTATHWLAGGAPGCGVTGSLACVEQ